MRDSILELLIKQGLKPSAASKTADALVRLLVDRLPKFTESGENAAKHFNKKMFVDDDADLQEFYEALHDDCQSEWDGLTWGWNDAVTKIRKLFEISS